MFGVPANSLSLGVAILALIPLSSTLAQSAIAHERVAVAATNDEWTPTTITVGRGDVVLIVAGGRIRVGQMIGETGPDGTTRGEGALYVKIGVGAGQPAGAREFIIADQSGPVKLRINDTRYSDNSGEYEVSVVHIPASAIPPAASPTAESAYPSDVAPALAAVQSDLRNLVTAQEAYFADSVRYAPRVSALWFTTSRGVRITEIKITSDGWIAYATHALAPEWICAIHVGSGPAPSPGQKEGAPNCWK